MREITGSNPGKGGLQESLLSTPAPTIPH